jgi:hypothetical protein
MRGRLSVGIGLGLVLSLGILSTALADPSPNGPGQPGAPNTTCEQYPVTPGASAGASGSVFNPDGTAGTVYAGNPGTASAANAESTAAVSQYDIACFQNTPH